MKQEHGLCKVGLLSTRCVRLCKICDIGNMNCVVEFFKQFAKLNSRHVKQKIMYIKILTQILRGTISAGFQENKKYPLFTGIG